MKTYCTAHLVKSEDLNHHKTLFAARAAAWFVESGFVCAACEHGEPQEIVCRNLHNMSFSSPVRAGNIVNLSSQIVAVGTTSFTVHVGMVNELENRESAEGYLTFVVVDPATGGKKPHNIVLDACADERELRLRDAASKLKKGQ